MGCYADLRRNRKWGEGGMTVVNTEADGILIKYFSCLLTSPKDCIPPDKVNVSFFRW